jgi:ribose transport system substrate-binding protein
MLSSSIQTYLAICFCLFGVTPGYAQFVPSPPPQDSSGADQGLAEMRLAVGAACAPGIRWDGPVSGPSGRSGAMVAIVSEDLRNGGILGVANGISEAAKEIGWTVKVYDAGGTPSGREKAVSSVVALKPDGVMLVGVDALQIEPLLKPLAERRVPIVGWHVGPFAGSLSEGPIAMNVSTNPLDVARITAKAAVVESRGRAGVVVFTDSNFAIAKAKSDAMVDVVKACAHCTLLEVRDIAISKSAALMPVVTQELLARYGARWTHALAVNDIYFDYAVPELTKARVPSNGIGMLSAGDGSAAAFLRIQAETFQIATVAEPLNLQGWQLVDELNRLLARQPVTGFVIPVHLVTGENIAFDGGPMMRYDPDNGYRDIYRRIWKR